MYRSVLTALFIATCFFSLSLGCSSSSKTPVTAPDNDKESLSSVTEADNGHVLWGIWDVTFDVEKMTAEVVASRDVEAHINITTLIPSPQINVLGYDPVTKTVNALVTISNPYSIEGYDVRVILFTNDQGLRLTNDDGWTDLYDIAGGKSQNPFKAYAKTNPLRKFFAHSQQSEQFLIYFPSPSGPVKFAVDASYPTNCLEPYQFQNFTQTALYDTPGSQCDLTVQVSDWQNDTNAVRINAYQINGVVYTEFNYQAAQANWKTTIINALGVSAGQYECVLVAMSANSGFYALYDYVNIAVTATPCGSDANNKCSDAYTISSKGSTTGCIDPADNNDWYRFYTPPGGIQNGNVKLQFTGASSYMFVYGMDPGGTCPGTMLGYGTNVNLTASTNSIYYVLVTGATGRSDYQVTTTITPALSNVQCDIYVAQDSSGNWPIWEDPNPDVELTMTHLQNQIMWNNYLWNQYGYNLVWDGTVTIMASKYYILNNQDESWEMHNLYGKGTNKVSLYFVDYLDSGMQTAYARPLSPRSQHTVNNTFSAYSPNVWLWQQAVSHEHGHVLGYFFDQYIFDQEGVACGAEGSLPPGYPTFLYSDPLACYNGNLMWYYFEGWTWNRFNLTIGQQDFMHNFHFIYYNNFPWY